jgi:hypothetical protein
MLAFVAVVLAECPYHAGDGSSMFCARSVEPAQGADCPELQLKRSRVFTEFVSGSYHDFMESAKTFPLAPLFDKSQQLVGDELFESMMKLHVECMKDPKGVAIEDKILLKQTAAQAGVPTTTMYFGAHVDDFDREAFRSAMLAVCAQGVDALFFKATHMAWSMGQRIVSDWQRTCADPNATIEELADWIVSDVFTLHNDDPSSAHLEAALKPGVIVEEIFQTGGESTKPLEAKALVLWGKVFDVWMMGMDERGCKMTSGTWKVYGNGAGWNLHGLLNEEDDAESTTFMRDFYPQISTLAERFATHLGADVARVDFFIGEGGVVKLNEVETVSGSWYEIERRELGDLWRDGYLASGRMEMDPAKWQKRLADTSADRDHLLYGAGTVVV